MISCVLPYERDQISQSFRSWRIEDLEHDDGRIMDDITFDLTVVDRRINNEGRHVPRRTVPATKVRVTGRRGGEGEQGKDEIHNRKPVFVFLSA